MFVLALRRGGLGSGTFLAEIKGKKAPIDSAARATGV
jgi:hypothetical protein